jgi:HEAT repeat protein
VTAFDRLLVDPVKRDPGCVGKTAIADALYRLGAGEEELFLRGIRHRQMEPVWGGRTDTAGGLRSACGFGLVRMHAPCALLELAGLLADPETPVRVEAARAIAYGGSHHALPILKLKILVGDAEGEVVSECMGAMLQIAPSESLEFVCGFLDADDLMRREAAALALGASRVPSAFEVLTAWWDRTHDLALRRTALLAIAILRSDRSIAFLLGLVAEAEGPIAREAIRALAVYRDDTSLAERVRDVARARRDVALESALDESF